MNATKLRSTIEGLGLSLAMMVTRGRHLRPMLAAATQPAATQERLLREIVRRNAETEFGIRHGFGKIRGLADWRAAVPVQSYEDVRPWIDRQAETGGRVLTDDPPVMFNLTSGTTSLPKLIPVTASGLDRYRGQQRAFAGALHRHDRRLFSGRIAGIGGNAVEGRHRNGLPYGSAAGVIYREMPAAVRARYVVPAAAFAIADYDLRYRAIATCLLAADDVTIATTANPSTFLRLLDVANGQLDVILADIAAGRLSVDVGLGTDARAEVEAGLVPAPARAAALARIAAAKGNLDYVDIWPRLHGIATWTGGSCAIALSALRPRLGPDVAVYEFGYLASEFRGTCNVEPQNNLCLPTLRDTLFEFADPAAWEAGDHSTVGLEALEAGRQYRVIATTPDGLYRYDINDIVEVVGFISGTPALAFVRKGRGVTSITGEKLSEEQFIAAVARACTDAGIRPVFHLGLADEIAGRYHVYLEPDEASRPDTKELAANVDRELIARNLEYAAKRASGRLGNPSLVMLRTGCAEAYRRHKVAAGQRDAQYKVVPLHYVREMTFDLAPWQIAT